MHVRCRRALFDETNVATIKSRCLVVLPVAFRCAQGMCYCMDILEVSVDSLQMVTIVNKHVGKPWHAHCFDKGLTSKLKWSYLTFLRFNGYRGRIKEIKTFILTPTST